MLKSIRSLLTLPLGFALGCVGSTQVPPPLPPNPLRSDLAALPNAAKAAQTLDPYLSPFAFRDLYVAPGSSLSKTIAKLNLPHAEQTALIASLEAQVDPSRIASGTQLKSITLHQGDQLPSRIETKLSAIEILTSEHCGPTCWTTTKKSLPLEHRTAGFAGVVSTTLWNSAGAAGMDQQLTTKLTDVFAWQFDSSREVQSGDRWRLTIDQTFAAGKPVAYGEIVAAEYSRGGKVYAAVRYDTNGTPHFYTPKGDSLRRLFLKSPLRFARVTSGFSKGRFHPILRVRRPHMGIDYGAPRGTPVMAVGDGEVSVAARRGASGNMIALKHTSSYETMYKHLSRFADGIKPGAKVSSGQIIGYVGATGRATGPHLHFELHVNGRYVDPAAIAFPAADPVPATDLDKFRLVSSKAVASLPAWSSDIISTAALRQERLAE